jgi:hypothetical protein
MEWDATPMRRRQRHLYAEGILDKKISLSQQPAEEKITHCYIIFDLTIFLLLFPKHLLSKFY